MPAPSPTRRQYLTARQVATKAGLHPSTIRRYAKNGELPPSRILPGGRREWLESEVNDWLDELEAGPAEEMGAK